MSKSTLRYVEKNSTFLSMDRVQDIRSVCAQLERAAFAHKDRAILLMKSAKKTLTIAIDLIEKEKLLKPPPSDWPDEDIENQGISEGKKLHKPWKNLTITEALIAVRDAALEGRKLEAWCEGSCLAYSYNPDQNIFLYRVIDEDKCEKLGRYRWYPAEWAEFSVDYVLGTWHIKEVEE